MSTQPDNIETIDPREKGQKYLDMLELGHLASSPMMIDGKPVVRNDRTLQVVDFLEVCGQHAGPQLDRLAGMPRDDPTYEPLHNALKTAVSNYVEVA